MTPFTAVLKFAAEEVSAKHGGLTGRSTGVRDIRP